MRPGFFSENKGVNYYAERNHYPQHNNVIFARIMREFCLHTYKLASFIYTHLKMTYELAGPIHELRKKWYEL